MQKFVCLALAAVLCGCAGSQRQGVSVSDPVDAVKIDQMVGNHVSGAVFERTLVCLNARRETRWISAITNQSIVTLTNVTLSYVTNQTVSLTTNQQQTLATNILPVAQLLVGETNATESTLSAAAGASGPSTNLTVTTASNVTVSRAPTQTATTANFQTQRSRQFTANSGPVSITTADNQIVTAETNLIVNVFTNVTLTSLTNVNVVVTNAPVHEHFIVLEYTPPMDFTLASGESLVLLVDGVRHSLATGTTQTVLVARRGFSAVAYKAAPQLLVDIANAKRVALRVKGTNQVIERDMKRASRENFKRFLVNYFSPETAEAISSAPELNPKDS